MAEIKALADTTLKTCLNTGTEGTTLNNIAQDARAISNTTGDIDNTTELDLFADFELSCEVDAAVAIGAVVAHLYLLRSVDGTNFPDGSTSVTPQPTNWVGSFIAAANTAAQRLVLNDIRIGPGKTRVLLVIGPTSTGFTAADTHTLKAKLHKLQAV